MPYPGGFVPRARAIADSQLSIVPGGMEPTDGHTDTSNQNRTRSVLTLTRTVTEGHNRVPRLRSGLVSLRAAMSQSGPRGG